MISYTSRVNRQIKKLRKRLKERIVIAVLLIISVFLISGSIEEKKSIKSEVSITKAP
ncbi:hypothetical protein [Winogradskyella sp.]|uniref:hypothetical protein n=1 Tax=Winogradskyella sp. TaxID=1883156 RepID=UPI0025F8B986|nr:hypothetical protein [Winogradskyella sp.]